MQSLKSSYRNKASRQLNRSLWQKLHLDPPLLGSLAVLLAVGLFILYSAGNENFGLITRQLTHIFAAVAVMIICAQIPPRRYYQWAPWLFIISLLFLIAVLVVGHLSKGAVRWLNLGLFRFQPSEIMQIAMPMALAWFFGDKALPPNKKMILLSLLVISVPTLLVAKEPDLGTALIIACGGIFVLFLAGMRWRYIISFFALLTASTPILWHFMHGYQRERVLTFFNPERDPLGAGYHIIQSKIAIGSGGFFGEGWLNGSQSHLHFLPEHATDFIFGVIGEELGFLGALLLIILFLVIFARGLFISSQAQDTFSRLLSGSLILTFFISLFVNIGMVTGILPVVGLPLPLISYGGTSMVTIMASFGIIMSIHSHRKLLGS